MRFASALAAFAFSFSSRRNLYCSSLVNGLVSSTTGSETTAVGDLGIPRPKSLSCIIAIVDSSSKPLRHAAKPPSCNSFTRSSFKPKDVLSSNQIRSEPELVGIDK